MLIFDGSTTAGSVSTPFCAIDGAAGRCIMVGSGAVDSRGELELYQCHVGACCPRRWSAVSEYTGGLLRSLEPCLLAATYPLITGDISPRMIASCLALPVL